MRRRRKRTRKDRLSARGRTKGRLKGWEEF
jgi:hypothetical protein